MRGRPVLFASDRDAILLDGMEDRTPLPGDVYRNEHGHLCLFVRTETRSGLSVDTGANGTPEHHFIYADADRRISGDFRVRADEPFPDRLELVVNAGAEREIFALKSEVLSLWNERDAFTLAMRRAVEVVPVDVGQELRRIYLERRSRILTSSEAGI